MSKEKKKRHHRKRAAPTASGEDLSDLDSAAATSRAQREEYDEADGANSGNELVDEQATIFAGSQRGAGAEIQISRGLDDGVQVGMSGYIKSADGGVLGWFTVEHVYDRSCTAVAPDTTFEQVKHNKSVVLNPSHGG